MTLETLMKEVLTDISGKIPQVLVNPRKSTCTIRQSSSQSVSRSVAMECGNTIGDVNISEIVVFPR